jgi:hypothetical protein
MNKKYSNAVRFCQVASETQFLNLTLPDKKGVKPDT